MAAKRLARKTLTVLVDMDGVLAEFEGPWLARYRAKYPDAPFVPLEERRTFYIDDQYDDEYRDNINSIIQQDGFFGSLPPIKGACDALKEMSGLPDVEVFICSSPLTTNYRACSGEKGMWIERNLGRDWLRRFILTTDKTMVRGDILIDDKHRITGAMIPAWEHVVFTSCHNKHIQLNGRKRLDGWLPRENWMGIIDHFKKKCLS